MAFLPLLLLGEVGARGPLSVINWGSSTARTDPDVGEGSMAFEQWEVETDCDNKEGQRADQVDDEGVVSKVKPKDVPFVREQQLIILVPQDVRHMQVDKYIKEVECGNDSLDDQNGSKKICGSVAMVSSE